MLTFLIAYLLLWLGVLGYVLRLAVGQRRLQRAMLELLRRLEASEEARAVSPLPLGEGQGVRAASLNNARPHPNPLPEGEGTLNAGFPSKF
jgi:hypothetical protein